MMTCRQLLALLLLSLAWPATAQTGSPPAAPAEQTETAPATDEDPALAPRLEDRPFGVPFGHAWLGAADGDVTLLVFADYACPACRAAQPVIDDLIAADPHLRVVYLILVNEEEGRQAAMTSVAVAQTGADWSKFHHALDAGGDPGPAGIAAALKAAGIDPASLPPLSGDALIDRPILAELNRNDRLLVDHKGTALPAWLTGTGKARNGFDPVVLRAAIAKARGK
jgi:protein-disulfide isomerase